MESKSVYAPYIEQCDVSVLAKGEEKPYHYHDCRENVLRNLFNNILYNPKEDVFDIEILGSIHKVAKKNGSTSLIDKIIAFYKVYNSPAKQGTVIDRTKGTSRFSLDKKQLVVAATEWADLLSGLYGVTYWWPTGRVRRPFTLGDTHEINAGIGNYLRVFAHIFGLICDWKWKSMLLDFATLEELFASVGVTIRFHSKHTSPLPESNLTKPATLDNTQYDNHDIDVHVELTKEEGSEPLKFKWIFIVGHLEVFFKGGDYDH